MEYENDFFDDYAFRGGLSYLPQYAAPSYTAPAPFVPQYQEPQYFAPEPFVPQYREPEPQPFVPQYQEPVAPQPTPSYPEPMPTTQVSANFASAPEPTGGLSAAAEPAPFVPQYQEPVYYAPEPFVPQYQEPTYTPPAPPAPQPMAQPAASWGTGGLGSYQLSDPSLAATPDWLKNRDPSLNRVDWGGNYDPATGRLGVLPFFVGGSEAQDASYFQGGDTSDMSGYAGVLETGLPTYKISTEFGRPVDNYLKLNPASENPVRIINASKGEIAYEGASDPRGLVSALDQVTADGNKDIWSVQEKVGDQWVTTAENKKEVDILLNYMLPVMLSIAGGAALGPLLGGTQGTLLGAGKLAAAAGAGLGSAAGSFTGNVAAGKPLDDALKAAAITGLTAGVLKGVMPGGSGLGPMPDIDYAGLNNIVFGGGAALPAAALEPLLTSTASTLGSAALPAVFGSLTGAAVPAALQPSQPAPAQADPTITVTQQAPTGGSPLASVSAGAPEAIQYLVDPAEVTGQTPAPEPAATKEPGIVVTSRPYPNVDLTGGLATVPVSTLLNLGINTPTDVSLGDTEIDVAGRRIRPGRVSDVIPAATGALNLGTPPIDISLPGGDGELIDVAGNRIRPTRLPDVITTSLLSEIPGTKPTVYDPNQIVVTGQRELPATRDPEDLLAPVASEFVVSDLVNQQGKSLEQEQAEKSGKKGMSTFGKITGGLAILDALGNLLGGGGGGGAGAGGATGLDALAPTFRAQLPAPRGQFTPQALGQRPAGEAGRPAIDYARYGYGPARSFFNYVPETQAERDAFAATAAAPAAPRVGVGSVFGPMSAGAAPAGGSSNNIGAGLLPALAKAAGAPLPAVAFDSLNIDYNKFADSKMMQDLGGQFRNAVAQSAAPTGATDSVLRAGFEKLRAAVPGASDAELVEFLGTPEGQQELAMIFEGLGATRRAKGGRMGDKGRESFAVNGTGTGRSDEIPALLSDGEYVIDAETVALLGDGSGKAGAQRLDEFRAKIRKHKGRNLAKGKFSVNAKRPERYLSGGLV